MSLYTPFAANVLFPLHERLKGHRTIEVFRQLEETQWLSAEKIAQLQLDKLKAFLAEIGKRVPYYRELFNKLGFDPSKVDSLRDIQRLPLLDKPTIRANLDHLKSVDAGPLQRFNTGGSSGEPLIFYLGKERVSHDVAAKRRATRWWGVDIGDPEIVVWGSPIELGAQDRVKQIRDELFRTHLLSAFEMSREKLDEFVASILKIKPKMLFGYPSSLALIAAHAQSMGTSLNNLGIRVAFVTSERLYEHQQEKIETVFGCPVANGYGGRDAGFIAHQCPRGSMHITAEDILVEIVDPDGNILPAGESGEIVITHLATSEFPFVRYRTGDIGTLGSALCDCGRGLPVLKEIQGRTTDFVVAEDGTILHGLALIYVMRDLPGIESFKIIQDSLSRTTVQIVKGSGYQESHEQEIVKTFRQRLGASVDVKLDYVSEIANEKSGKFRYIVSHVNPGRS